MGESYLIITKYLILKTVTFYYFCAYIFIHFVLEWWINGELHAYVHILKTNPEIVTYIYFIIGEGPHPRWIWFTLSKIWYSIYCCHICSFSVNEELMKKFTKENSWKYVHRRNSYLRCLGAVHWTDEVILGPNPQNIFLLYTYIYSYIFNGNNINKFTFVIAQ